MDRPAGAGAARTALIANLPGFVLIRIGLLMLGVDALRVPGVLLFAIGVALQTAAVSSMNALMLTTQFVDTDPDRTSG